MVRQFSAVARKFPLARKPLAVARRFQEVRKFPVALEVMKLSMARKF
jgi:hypothetical protein